jgi:hypothetical protein
MLSAAFGLVLFQLIEPWDTTCPREACIRLVAFARWRRVAALPGGVPGAGVGSERVWTLGQCQREANRG